MVIHECNIYKTGYLVVSGMRVMKLIEEAQRASFCKEDALQSSWIGPIWIHSTRTALMLFSMMKKNGALAGIRTRAGSVLRLR
ncbi:MAG: hypothetical protein ACFFBJ_03425, partial [Promethearchaeota archaeon]